jgi:hypothetical protein
LNGLPLQSKHQLSREPLRFKAVCNDSQILGGEAVKFAIPWFIFVLAAISPTLAHSESRVVFRDGRHECWLDYDRNVFTRGSLDSENYRRFVGPNNDTHFRVTALPNDENLTPNEIRKEYLVARGTKDLVYERTKSEFLVLSGYRGRNIFYTKIALSSDNETICVLHISYPRKAKRAFDSRVTRMSRSFSAKN